ERAVLVPVELVDALKAGIRIAPFAFLLGGLGGPDGFWSNAMSYGLFAVFGLFAAIIAGAIASPLLLPLLPGRAFALKGLVPGIVAALALLAARAHIWGVWPGPIETTAWLLVIPGLTAYLSMNFTGASTYTSLSGVRKEMRWAVPFQIAAVVLGIGLWLVARFTA
ncbi:MAG: mercury methylation corrinoid protein HgcA, partial [Pseudomonadota bacterium]